MSAVRQFISPGFPPTAGVSITIFIALILSACSSSTAPPSNSNEKPAKLKPPSDLVAAMKAVEPFFTPMGKPGPFDWLATHNEKGQTFEEFLNEDPNVPTEARRTIYIQPLGRFNSAQKRVVRAVSDYVAAFYGLPVKMLPEKQFPAALRIANFRTGPNGKTRQIRTGYILNDILKPALPSDAAALLAFTNEDLYPDASMNYVFGQASLEARVGVWSLARLDDAAGPSVFLARALKVAAHETGHMFGMRHCTKYECVMSGTNYLGETDRRPIDACPECMAKICWMTGTTPEARYKRLEAFAKHYSMPNEAAAFEKKAEAVRRAH